MVALLVSVVIVSIAASLRVYSIGNITPKFFFFEYTLVTLVMLIVGGRNSVTGALAGVAVISVARELARRLGERRVRVLRVWRSTASRHRMVVPRGPARHRARRSDARLHDPAAQRPAARLGARPVVRSGVASAEARRRRRSRPASAHRHRSRSPSTERPSRSAGSVPSTAPSIDGVERRGGRPDRPERGRQDHARQRDHRHGAADVGRSVLDGRPGPHRARRRTGIARAGLVRTFQNLRLFSSLTVRDNVEAAALSPLRPRSRPPARRRRRPARGVRPVGACATAAPANSTTATRAGSSWRAPLPPRRGSCCSTSRPAA